MNDKMNDKMINNNSFSIKKTLLNLFLDKHISENLSDLENLKASENADIKDILTKHFFHRLFRGDENKPSDSMINNNDNTAKLGDDVLSDLEVLQDYQNANPKNTVIHALSACPSWPQANHHTQGAFFFLAHILSHPLRNPDVLKERQTMIKNLHHQAHLKELNHGHAFSWKMIEKNEKKMVWFLHQDNGYAHHLNDLVYLNYWLLDRINRSAPFLTGYNLYRIILSPLIGIFTPICYVIIPFLVIKWKYKLPINFKTYLQMTLTMFMSSIGLPKSLDRLRKISVGFTIVFYFQGLFNSIELSRAIYKLTKMLVTKMNGFINFVHHSHHIIQSLGPNYMHSYSRFGFSPDDIHCFPEEEDPNFSKLNIFEDCFDPTTAINKRALGGEDGEDFTLCQNFGRQLAHFKYLNIQDYIPLIQKIYFIDCLLSIGMLTISCSPPLKRMCKRMCWVNFRKESELPYFSVTDCYHPCLTNIPFEKVVKNDISMSKENISNIILTGPNAGGKSTLIKSAMLSILLAQTLTVANGSAMEITPFTFINTQINIPDCKGKQSLFEAEMMRSKNNFDVIGKLGPGKFSIIAMDEIFSSTNPIEGMAGAYAIARKLGENHNVMNIISTHYAFLTKLEKKENGMYKNYKMNVDLDENNMVVSYPYKLYRGVSKQYIALELLRKNGFDPSIIDEAVALKNSFLSSNPKPLRSKRNTNAFKKDEN